VESFHNDQHNIDQRKLVSGLRRAFLGGKTWHKCH